MSHIEIDTARKRNMSNQMHAVRSALDKSSKHSLSAAAILVIASLTMSGCSAIGLRVMGGRNCDLARPYTGIRFDLGVVVGSITDYSPCRPVSGEPENVQLCRNSSTTPGLGITQAPGLIALVAIDIPLSAAVDTLLLPLDYYEMKRAEKKCQIK